MHTTNSDKKPFQTRRQPSEECKDGMEEQEFEKTCANKRNFWKMFQAAVFILCLTGFSYQATEFVTNFYTYPTVLNMAIKRLDKIPTPALTVCSKFLFKFDKYCNLFRDRCERPKDLESFCQEYPLRCHENLTDPVTPMKFPQRNEYSYSYVIRNVEAIPFFYGNDYFGNPFFVVNQIDNYTEVCMNSLKAYSENGLPTLNIINNSKNLWVYFFVSYEWVGDDTFFDQEPYATLHVRSPFLKFDLLDPSVTLKLGHQYSINMGLEEERLLPAPYETDCQDYLELWKKNNMTGPLSREMCEYDCVKTNNKSYFEEEYENVMEDYFCEKVFRIHKGFARKNDVKVCTCRNQCKAECLKLNYNLSVLELNETWVRRRMPSNKSSYVALYIDSSKTKILSYKPQYMDVELFSYIGGFLGCWLGISLWTFNGLLYKGYSVLVSKFKKSSPASRRKSKNSAGHDVSIGVEDPPKEVS